MKRQEPVTSSPGSLLDRIELGFNFATRMVDPEQDYLPYWGLVYNGRNVLRHGRIDRCDTPFCWMEIILVNRALTGTQKAPEVEAGLRKWCATDWQPDGLHYPVGKAAEGAGDYCFLHGLAYVLDAMVSWYSLTGEADVRKRIDGLIAACRRIAVPANLHADLGAAEAARETSGSSALYFPFNNYVPGKVWDPAGHSVVNNYELPGTGTFILPLARYYEMTGDERAGELAAGLTEYMLNVSYLYGHDGRFIGHFHRHLWSIAGILKYAVLTGNDQYLSRARRVYGFAEQLGSPFGWFPEMVGLNSPADEYSETCCIYDMIHGALTLARSGCDEYWDRVSCYAKNQLMKSQFTEPGALDDGALAARLVGGFTGWTQVNDYFTRKGEIYPCGCCTFHGVKALHCVWEAACERKGRDTWIHLLFDRENDDLVMRSWLPQEGRVTVELKRPGSLCLRIPPWARENLAVARNGQAAPAEWRGNYLAFRNAKPGDEIRVEFTVPEWGQEMEIGGRPFRIEWRGDVVTRVEPGGSCLPLYERPAPVPRGG
ncbi:MAG: hypothetical protein QF541_21100 [Lentisphaeria bacterium]|jgi:hypothetical protein|nr:hypothetical protein [Lentisphaeria bacterium]